jgi:peptidoglycan/xylan/chitin deacetylase (PgdA/CDA1 family)
MHGFVVTTSCSYEYISTGVRRNRRCHLYLCLAQKTNYDSEVFMKAILLSSLLVLMYWSCNQPQRNTPAKENKSIAAPTKFDTTLKHIYITFDDGPLEGSEDIDDAVRNEKINVNVFIVGSHALSNDRMKNFYKLYENNPYIEIGNHSFSHAYNHYEKFYKNPASVINDFTKCESDLHIPTKLVRLPGRNQWRLQGIARNDMRSGAVCADMLFMQGYKVFGWDLEWQHDGETGDPVQSVSEMVKLIEMKLQEHTTVKQNNLVLLAHDEMFRNGWEESELKQLIDTLKAKGNYSFDHLSKYPE